MSGYSGSINYKGLYEEERTESKRLRGVIKKAIKECPICGGSGYLDDAIQAWDVPGMNAPPCGACKPLRQALNPRKEDTPCQP
jgi:hypothetical protein